MPPRWGSPGRSPKGWGNEGVASVNGLAGSGITGGEAGPARGRRPRQKAAGDGGPPPAGPARGGVGEQGADSGPAVMTRVAVDGVSATAGGDDLFARYTRDYVAARFGQQVAILLAGCTTAGTDLAAGALRAEGANISVSLLDDDRPVTSAAIGLDDRLRGCVQGDLRTVPLPPRSADIVLCALLLHRIRHPELVLDRLVAAIKPGGLLLLRFRDRDSASGFLDRVLPGVIRTVIWRRRYPGKPGPYPAVYEPLTSARGVQAYALRRGLVIAERAALSGVVGTLPGPPAFLAAQRLVARLSGGRLADAHEELLYVLRKPENRFARVL